jgi:peptidoglycan-associated lipoprotein
LGATLALAAGCHTDNYYQNPPSAGRSGASQAAMPVAISDVTNSAVAGNSGVHPAWNEDRTSLKVDNVYFAFDKSAIKPLEQSKLNNVADFLKRNAQVSILIEGNCDERGTEEFNRELGVRRAEASRDYLVSLGIDRARIQTLSRGKDNPAVTGEGGESRSLNRRDEFVVLTSDKAI